MNPTGPTPQDDARQRGQADAQHPGEPAQNPQPDGGQQEQESYTGFEGDAEDSG